jgi:hypothetical protein
MPGTGSLTAFVNPPGTEAVAGAAFLARCFASPWTQDMVRWYLQRDFDGESPDRVLLMDGVRVVASCGLAYRRLRTSDGRTHLVGIVVAACTAPGERGRGCYAHLLQAAVERCAQRGCTALLGFVTADNATGRGLLRLGATAVPSLYISSRGGAWQAMASVQPLRASAVLNDWLQRAGARLRFLGGEAGFHYPDLRAWRSQMLARPHPVEALGVGESGHALIERVGRTDRLQWLDTLPRERTAAVRTLVAAARRHGRHFFMYSTRRDDGVLARRLGLAARPGFMMALAPQARHVATVRAWAAMRWHVQSGDRL